MTMISGYNFEPGADLSGLDLSNLDINDLNLTDINFSGSNLTNTNITNCNLSGSNFTGSDLTNANIKNTYLGNTNIFSGSEASVFADTNLTNADFSNSNLGGVNFSGLDLTNVNLEGTYLENTNFSNAKLTNVNFYNSLIFKTEFSGSELTGSNFYGVNYQTESLEENGSFITISFSENDYFTPEQLDTVIYQAPNVIPFNSSENATIISLSSYDIPDISEGVYHLYHDNWSKHLSNFDYPISLGPLETSILRLQEVELDTSNEINDTTDYKATDAMPIQLSSYQITALKAANGSEADNNLILNNMHMNLSNVPDVMRVPEFEIPTNSIANAINFNLEPNANLSGIDLNNVDLSYLDLSGINLSGADLTNANLTFTNLSNANLRGVNLSNAILDDTNLTFVDLSNTDLENINFSNANLYNANLSYTNLSNAILQDAQTSGIELTGANFYYATYTNWTQEIQSPALWFDVSAYTDNGYYFNSDGTIGGIDFSGADLTNKDLSGYGGYDLTGAKFLNANLSGANLSESILKNAIFTNANISNTNFTNTDLTNANLYGTNYNENTTLTQEQLDSAIFQAPSVIPFSSSENATIISLSTDDIPGVSEGTYHLYHDGWNKGLHNVELGPPTEASSIFLQSVELDMSNDGSDTTDYKATEAMPIQLSSDQIAALKIANGTEADNNLILINMHMNMSSVPDVMREPESSAQTEVVTYVVTVAYGTNGYGSGNKYYIDGVLSPPLNLVSGKTYEFDLLAVPSSHPFHLSTSPNGTWGEGTIYEQVNRTQDKLTITINDDTPDLYYFCEDHSGMGYNSNIDQIIGNETATFTASIDKWQSDGLGDWMYGPMMKLHRKDISDEVGIDLSMKDGHPGHKHKEDMDKGSYELRVEHNQQTDGAIDIDDVMGVLSLSRGKSSPTGKEHKLAADWNGDGIIDIDDVMGVLARSRGKSKDDEWRFHDKESDTSLWDNTSKTNKMDITLEENDDIDLTAILRGDVNGSYNANEHNRPDPSQAPTPNYAPLPVNNDDELQTINLDIV